MNQFISQVASKETIELMTRFFEAATNAVRKANYDDHVLEAFDLIQAISCYRYFPTVEKCLEAFPSLEPERHKVEYIWEQFGKLSTEQLSNVYIASLNKLSLHDKAIQ